MKCVATAETRLPGYWESIKVKLDALFGRCEVRRKIFLRKSAKTK